MRRGLNVARTDLRPVTNDSNWLSRAMYKNIQAWTDVIALTLIRTISYSYFNFLKASKKNCKFPYGESYIKLDPARRNCSKIFNLQIKFGWRDFTEQGTRLATGNKTFQK